MKKRRWEVWKRPDGSTYLVWGTKSQSVTSNPDDLKQFAKNLLARSGLDGVPTTAWPWQQRGEAN